jgi:hypothetical protein
LKSAGCTTGHCGKRHFGLMRADSPVSPGKSGLDQCFSRPNFFEAVPWVARNSQAVRTTGEGSEVIVERRRSPRSYGNGATA